MKIAILGTRGIPNTYGGFEQCAEKLSVHFFQRGHEVTVYMPADHPYREDDWCGIRLKRVRSNERLYSFLNAFLLDYVSLKDAVASDFDIILELGYSPCALFYYLKNNRSKLVTNMAGLEWQRSKWNTVAKEVIKYSEKRAVEKSDAIIADNPGILDYLFKKYGRESRFIAYGAELYECPHKEYLDDYGLRENRYFMLVARLQPDNNIEMILDGFILSDAQDNFVVVGDCSSKYGAYLRAKYKKRGNILFAGGIYDNDRLGSLRWYSKMYFHGHSCGGTNPSLLEAMASNAYIAAHENVFNRHVLGNDGLYFNSSQEVSELIRSYRAELRTGFTEKNMQKIIDHYRWDRIAEEYLAVFRDVLAQ